MSWGEQYKSYKKRYVKNLLFVPEESNPRKQSKLFFIKAKYQLRVSGVLLEHAPLEEVYIFFDTATYDQIERDVKVDIATFEKKTISKENREPLSLLTRFTYDLYHKAIHMIHSYMHTAHRGAFVFCQ